MKFVTLFLLALIGCSSLNAQIHRDPVLDALKKGSHYASSVLLSPQGSSCCNYDLVSITMAGSICGLAVAFWGLVWLKFKQLDYGF